MAASTPYPSRTPQSFFQGNLSYATSSSTKHTWTFLAYPSAYLNIFWGLKIWSVVLQLGQKPHWVFSSSVSIISRHLFSRHLARTYSGKLRKLRIAILSVPSRNTSVLDTYAKVKELIYSRLGQFSGRISSQTAAFPGFSVMTLWLPAVMAFSSSKCCFLRPGQGSQPVFPVYPLPVF